jgi:hypothetical protein
MTGEMHMKQLEFRVTQFVRGMAWHDIGKPFALGTPRHAALGYWLLRLTGYDGEALLALAHGHKKKKFRDLKRGAENKDPKKAERAQNALAVEPLRRYFEESDGESMPGLLVLCNSLDRLAASVYSFQGKGLHQHLEVHSLQNPFSRLPASIVGWEGPFVVPKDDLADVFEKHLWAHMRSELPEAWQAVLTSEAKTNIEGKSQPLPDPAPLPAGKDALQVLLRYMASYPERTYPSVNDTSLEQHCRLSGILAFVVHCNLEEAEEDLLKQRITWADGEPQYPVSDPGEVVRKHLKASLVRVAFEGHRALYESAVRVDDLHGARELADQMRETFKRALAHELSVPDLAEFLTISESQFDLIYLLPAEGEPLEMKIKSAYERALGQIVGQVADRLEWDFPQIAGHRRQLRQQLSDISYSLRVIPVKVPQKDIIDFDDFAAKYGESLLQAYIDSQTYVVFPAVNWPDWTKRCDNAEPLTAAETCQVCGNYPILTPSDDLSDEDKEQWQTRHDYAAHIFRGEREQLCLSCVARRTLAYGTIARQVDPLVHPMLKLDSSKPGLWLTTLPAEGPDLPPLLAPAVRLTRDDQMEDMNAFYVRYRVTRKGVDRSTLDIFPTTGYAADATSNVVLLSLQPQKASLFACYPYDKVIKEFEPEQSTSHSLIDGHTALWHETFVRFYRKVVKKERPELSEPIRHVQPHLARVMERIKRIQGFYEDLYHRLAGVEPYLDDVSPRLRVLPLDTEYPTLRLLLPADQLDKVLQRLEQAVTETLFSARSAEKDCQALHGLLKLLVPDLLHGVVVLFKHKFPLYLVLEAERDLFNQLEMTDKRKETSERPSRSDWYGLRLAFTDLRGTLSEVGPKRAEVSYADLGTVLDLTKAVDRRTVLQRAEAETYLSTELADALTLIRTKRTDLTPDQAEALNQSGVFPSVLFLKRATRE